MCGLVEVVMDGVGGNIMINGNISNLKFWWGELSQDNLPSPRTGVAVGNSDDCKTVIMLLFQQHHQRHIVCCNEHDGEVDFPHPHFLLTLKFECPKTVL